MGFEVFNKKMQYKGTPAVTITTLGRMAFNKAVTIIFRTQRVDDVILMWDKDKNLIGLQPITTKDHRSYKVRYSKRGDGSGFTANTFLKYIGYNASETQSLPIQWDEKEQLFTIEVPKNTLTGKK